MFKIIENDDGSTTVFCNETGRVICSVPKKRDKPLGIGRPIPREVEATSPSQLRPVSNNSNRHHESLFRISSPIQCCVTPLTWTNSADGILMEKCIFKSDSDVTLDADISDECITQQEFLQTLCLTPSAKVADGTWKELRYGLPTRFISQTSPKDEFHISSESKIYEDCDIVSPLGLKFLKNATETQKHTIDATIVDACIKKYNNYCRFALGSPYLSGASVPYSMRCREVKTYVSTYKSTKGQEYSHVYCFNRQQHEERLKVLKTGLTKRSRKLKEQCIEITVTCKRLTEKEIKKLTAPVIQPVTVKLENGQSDLANLKLPAPILLKEVRVDLCKLSPDAATNIESQMPSRCENSTHPSRSFKSLTSRKTTVYRIPTKYSKIIKKCSVKLQNVLGRLELRPDGGLYVRQTNIKVNVSGVKVVKLPLHMSKSFHTYARMDNDRVSRHNDHPYYRSVTRAIKNGPLLNGLSHQQYINNDISAKRRLSTQNASASLITNPRKKRALSSTHTTNHVTASSASSVFKNTNGSTEAHSSKKDIPFIDLSQDDDADDSISIVSTFLPSPKKDCMYSGFTFHCYGCNSRESFASKDIAKKAVEEHMVSYHAVMQPESFLAVKYDNSNKYVFIEAFPGFKGPS